MTCSEYQFSLGATREAVSTLLAARTEAYLSPSAAVVPPSPGHSTAHLPSPSEVVNASTPHTGVCVPPAECRAFDEAWLAKMTAAFATLGKSEELSEVLEKGTSNGHPMKLHVMALPPNQWFKIHAHPNLEWELTLAGVLREVRGDFVWPTHLLEERKGGFADGSWLEAAEEGMEVNLKSCGYQELTVPEGEHLANECGSFHQSFTGEEGACLLILWSGCHANITQDWVKENHDPRMNPAAGWA